MSMSLLSPSPRLATVPWTALDGLAPELLTALEKVLSGAPAAESLESLLRGHGDALHRNGRAALAEALFGISLWRRRLLRAAGLAFPPVGDLNRRDISTVLFVWLRDFGGLPSEEAGRLSQLAEDVWPAPRPPPTDLPTLASAPDWLVEDLRSELGELAPSDTDSELRAFFETLNVPGPVFLRVNTQRISREALAARLAEKEGITTKPTRWSPLGLEVTSPRPNIYGSAAYREGLYEAQDEGSQLLGLLVGTTPSDTVLDFCAGAGGKTLLLATQLEPKAALHAYDVDASRLERLERRAQKAQMTPHVRIHWSMPSSPLNAHRVLVDAPCSELGSLRRGPDVRWRLDPASFESLPLQQEAILGSAATHVRPGGTLVYATCTLRRAENEDVVSAFLQTHPGFRVTAPAFPLPPDATDRHGFVKLWPHRHGTDGFFAAVMQRTA